MAAQHSGTTESSVGEEHSKQVADGARSNQNPQGQVPATLPAAGSVKAKKAAKSKKGPDPNETGKLLAAKINQLELDAAGEKDQEQEIGMLKVSHNIPFL